jgi:hypothetical protein
LLGREPRPSFAVFCEREQQFSGQILLVGGQITNRIGSVLD